MQVYYWNVLFLQSPTIYSYFSCWLHWLSLGRTPEKHNEQDTFNTKPILGCQFTRNHWNRDNIHLQGFPKKFAFGNLAQFSPLEVFEPSKHRLLRTCLAHVPNANVFTLVYELWTPIYPLKNLWMAILIEGFANFIKKFS